MPEQSQTTKRTHPSVQDARTFASYLAEMRPVVEDYLRSHAPAPSEGEQVSQDMRRYVYEPFRRFTKSGGKRTRPVLTLLGCEAVGGSYRLALSSAAAIEDFQSAALIHDDIADEGQLRRGEPCTYLVEGVGVAINVGDLGIVRTFAGILEDELLDAGTKLEILARLAAMEQRTVEGQALDLGWARDDRWDISTEDYLAMARHKTAFYSAATPLAIGAVCGGATPQQIDALEAFGLDAGLAFQLQDDLLNLIGDAQRQGKDFRSDITEGKRTMAVTWSLEHLPSADANELVGLLRSHTSEAARLERAVALMEQARAFAAVKAYAQQLVDQAKHHLDAIELTPGSKELLTSMADYFIERSA